jgi:hypothetical protein
MRSKGIRAVSGTLCASCWLARIWWGDGTLHKNHPSHTASSALASSQHIPLSAVTQQEKTPPPRPNLLEAGVEGCEELKQQVSWEQEFLVGNSPGGSGRALCMVCGAEIRSPSADTARAHILEQHPHTLDLSPSEKSNILEAWSEGVALLQDIQADQPSLPSLGSKGEGWGRSGACGGPRAQWAFAPSESGQDGQPDPISNPDPVRMPAEIVVLLDSEDNPSLPKRLRPRGLRPLELPGQSTGKLWFSGTSCAKGLGWAGVIRNLRLKSKPRVKSEWPESTKVVFFCSYPCHRARE